VSRVQAMRKEKALEYTDRIRLALHGTERLRRVLDRFEKELATEVLAKAVVWEPGPRGTEVEVEGESVRIDVERV
jgi:isoleucyl-tRNA synthetase